MAAYTAALRLWHGISKCLLGNHKIAVSHYICIIDDGAVQLRRNLPCKKLHAQLLLVVMLARQADSQFRQCFADVQKADDGIPFQGFGTWAPHGQACSEEPVLPIATAMAYCHAIATRHAMQRKLW